MGKDLKFHIRAAHNHIQTAMDTYFPEDLTDEARIQAEKTEFGDWLRVVSLDMHEVSKLIER